MSLVEAAIIVEECYAMELSAALTIFATALFSTSAVGDLSAESGIRSVAPWCVIQRVCKCKVW